MSFRLNNSPYVEVHLEMVKPSTSTLASTAVDVVTADFSQVIVKQRLQIT